LDQTITGKVFDIQGFTVNDGPGIRTEIFLKGCPLRCLWCHSPESQSTQSQLAWYDIRCIGIEACGKCLKACPREAIQAGPRNFSQTEKKEIQFITLDLQKCDNCGRCTRVCPANALAETGVDMTVSEVMERINKDRPFYRRSGGGVTVSGGEPLLQHRFTAALFQECKNQALHTCLSTSGFAKWEILEEVARYTDLALYDIKQMDSAKSLEYVGVPNELILANARKLAEMGIALQIRIPVIPGYNDSEENLRATSQFCRKLGQSVRLVQILPYHRLGTVKYQRLQRAYDLEKVQPPTAERMEAHKKLIESYGLKVQIH
jgi:pyruvate formate lyase activating enzyme